MDSITEEYTAAALAFVATVIWKLVGEGGTDEIFYINMGLGLRLAVEESRLKGLVS